VLKNTILYFLVFLLTPVHALDTVRVLFVYGSKPKAKGEARWFGGIHGGHVSVQYGNKFASFVPDGKFHLIRSKKHINSTFITETGDRFVFDTTESRYLIVSIPVDSIQKRRLDSLVEKRLKTSPYDYAFIGMRCASAAYELLSGAGIYPKMSINKMSRKFLKNSGKNC
jgi:hypothetical protein